MKKSKHRTLIVIAKRYITPNLLRVTLGGQQMAGFPEDQASAYIKLILNQESAAKAVIRTYTIRAQRRGEIDIDFAIHQADGPAMSWALNSVPGDEIQIGGPGPKKMVDRNADWFVLVGDMTALPAISVNLSNLPERAKGYALIQVLSEQDIQALDAPVGMDIHWQINPEPGQDDDLLLEQIKRLPWLSGAPYVWCACEMNSMRRLREYFRLDRQLDSSSLYASSYWKRGVREEEHKRLKSRLG